MVNAPSAAYGSLTDAGPHLSADHLGLALSQARSRASLGIDRMGHEFDVCGIDAPPVSTKMIRLKPDRQRTHLNDVDQQVGLVVDPAHREMPIAVPGDAPDPAPAAIRFDSI